MLPQTNSTGVRGEQDKASCLEPSRCTRSGARDDDGWERHYTGHYDVLYESPVGMYSMI